MPDNHDRKYIPAPIDISGVKLPHELSPLTEMLASSIHDTWALMRFAEGWSPGPRRDDQSKSHPGLVPYAELPDNEKEYDRATAMGAVKSILAMGFSILPPEVDDAPERTPYKLARLQGEVKQLRKKGHSLLAHDIARKGLKFWTGDVVLRQLLALSLADLGATRRANEIMQAMRHEGHTDEETLGILARTHKDLWEEADARDDVDRHLQEAYAIYAQSFKANKGYYSGINAATMAVLLGRKDTARRLARQVRETCLAQLAQSVTGNSNHYYLTATLAEAALILGDVAEAQDRYFKAAEIGRGAYKDIQSTRRNARLLLDRLGMDGADILRALRTPSVAVFVGGGFDREGPSGSQFQTCSPEAQRCVAMGMADHLRSFEIGIGYASGAAGPDILFHEALLASGQETHLVLPYNKDLFKAECVNIDPESGWLHRFDAVYEACESLGRVTYASEWPVGQAGEFAFANSMLLGMARLKARHLETKLVSMAVKEADRSALADESPLAADCLRARGGTVEQNWLDNPQVECSYESTTNWLAKIRKKEALASPMPLKPTIKALLFADVAGYSKLREDQMLLFVEHFMTGIAKLTRTYKPQTKNTWGDSLYCVFRDPERAGLFALDLVDFVSGTDWEALGLPKDLNLRVSLHAGPVYRCKDPISGRTTYTGTHVSRAARFEPITPKGLAYASQSFAALAAALGVKSFACDYVGMLELAKNYGVFPTYRIRRFCAKACSQARRPIPPRSTLGRGTDNR